MRKLPLLFFLLLMGGWPAFGQGGSITAADAAGSTPTKCATAGACVYNYSIPQNASTASITVSGTFSATLQFEVSGDGVNFVAVNAYPPNSTTAVTSTTAAGVWTVNVAGMRSLQVRCSAFTSGAAVVSIYVTPAVSASSHGGGGGTGNTTSTSLTTNSLPKANGANSIIDSLFTDDGTTEAANGTGGFSVPNGPISSGTPPSGVGAGAVGGWPCTEATSSNWTPTAGTDWLRCDSTLHAIVESLNGGAEKAIPQIAGDLGGTAASPTVTNLSNVTNASLPLTGVATQAADSVDMNASGSTAHPTAVVLPACAASGHADVYDPSAHTWTCNAISGGGSGVVQTSSSTGNTATVTAAVLCSTTNCTAGLYRVDMSIIGSGTACSSVTAGKVLNTLGYTDKNGTAPKPACFFGTDQKARHSQPIGFNTSLTRRLVGELRFHYRRLCGLDLHWNLHRLYDRNRKFRLLRYGEQVAMISR